MHAARGECRRVDSAMVLTMSALIVTNVKQIHVYVTLRTFFLCISFFVYSTSDCFTFVTVNNGLRMREEADEEAEFNRLNVALHASSYGD